MTPLRVRPRFPRPPRRHAQRGVIMILTLIALVLLLIGVAAMVRSTDTATAVIGNLAFRRDLTNRAEVAVSTAKAALKGALLTDAARSTDAAASNYSATRLANAAGVGVPAVLVNDTNYAAKGYACLPASCTPGTDGVLTRWVIDRQCQGTAGTPLSFDTSYCGYIRASKDNGGSSQGNPTKPLGASRGLYRISVRVTGPRNTESYIQATAG